MELLLAVKEPPTYHKILPSGEVRFIMPERFYKVGEDYVTPHIPWAKPFAGGTVRVLIIASRYAHRETVELSQRLSLDYETIMTLGKPNEFAPESSKVFGCSPEEFRTEFEAKLTCDYDAIVFGRFYWNALPPGLEKLLVDKLGKGTGLILIFPPDGRNETLEKILSGPRDAAGERYIEDGVPVEHVPGFLSDKDSREEPLVRCVRHGEGRIVLLSYDWKDKSDYNLFSLTPQPPSDRVVPALAYDYYHSLVARAVLWAAGKAPQVGIRGIGMVDKPVDAGEFAETPIEIQIQNVSEKKLSAKLEVVARPWDGKEEQIVVQKVEVAPGESTAWIHLPRLAGGPHFIDVWLRQGGEVLDWFTGYVEIVPAAKVAAIELAQPSFQVGENVEGSVTIEGAVQPGTRLEINMVDSLDRVLARAESNVSNLPVTVPFSFPFEQPVAIQHRIVATLVDEHGVVDRKEQLFAPLDLKYDDFAFIAWGGVGNNSYRQRMLAQRCYELGVDSAYGYGLREADWEKNPIAYWTTRAGLSLFFYGSYLGGVVKDKIRSRCLSNPQEIAGQEAAMGSLARINRHMGGIGYSTGDEYPLARPGQDCCWSKWCLADLRKWLKNKYGTLEKLNQVWNSNFTSWQEVEPATLEEAKATGNYAPWSDGRAHMEYVFANIHRLLRLAVNKYHRGAPVGEEGMYDADTYFGTDWELFRDAATLLHGYERPTQHEHIRSLAHKDAITGYWFGSYYVRDYAEAKMRWHPWFSLFNGYNSAWWWTVSGAGTSTYPGGFNPDLTPCSTFDWTMQEVREIKRGPGKLLLNCQREHDGIAIHYSMNSHRATYSHPFGEKHWTGATYHARLGIGPAKTAWNMILEDLGLQYEYVCTADIENGALIQRSFRVFIMPVSQSLTEKEAEEIREFVQSGGTVIADLRPGVLNSVLNFANPGLLDELFGITRPDGPKPPIKMDVTVSLGGKTRHLPGAHVDGGVKLTSSKALGGIPEAPAVIQNSFGEGRATLLNFGLGDYYDEWRGKGSLVTDLRNTPWGQDIRGIIADLLAQGGVRPRLQVLRTSGEPLIAVESVFFRSGQNEYLGLLYKPDIIYFLNGDINWICKNYDLQPDMSPVPILVKLNKRYHIYDVRKGRYIGFSNRIRAEVIPGQALLYSLLPYQVTGVSLRGRARANRGERTPFQVSLQTEGSAPGMHCFHVEVVSPCGHAIREYAQNVIGSKGSASFTVPFALNDREGIWRVTVKDVASGMMAETDVKLVAP
jgi:beta-galactosidase